MKNRILTLAVCLFVATELFTAVTKVMPAKGFLPHAVYKKPKHDFKKLRLEFFRKFKTAVLEKDKNAVARLCQFPLNVYSCNGNFVIRNESELISGYFNVFNQNIYDLVGQQKFEELEVTGDGTMFWGGQIWLEQSSAGIRVRSVFNQNRRSGDMPVKNCK